MIDDLQKIITLVLPNDPSFRLIGREDLDRCIAEARQTARANAKDAFLLSLMRLLALPGNGHTRLIPNHAISVLPLRFVVIGTATRLLAASSDVAEAIGGELISINGVPIGEIERSAEEYLAGTRQRKRVIGPILFTWPGALQRLGVPAGGSKITYRIRTATGLLRDLPLDASDLVRASTFYPRNEHGKTDASWTPQSFCKFRDFGRSGMLMVLPSFFDSGGAALSAAVAKAAALAGSRPARTLLIDLRGNTGGDFLRTMPLIDAVSEGAPHRRVGLLVDKFTFSAAIVFAAILKHRLGERLAVIGEDMGDGLTFFAEGGTLELLSSGAAVRYSTAFHDWAGGRTDETTPAEIADRMVPAGTLKPDRFWAATSDDVESRDRFCREVLECLSA